VRLRLSSIEVMHLTAELIDLIDENSLIARHLHVPLQSGDDAVLADMKRRYDRRVFTERLAEVHEKIEDINLTTDVIVGFPTEDDPAFRSTLDYINATGFTRVHVFTYSNRPGTAAESMGDRVSIKDKKSRSREARSLSQKLQQRHRERKLGKVSEVLLESGSADGMLSGYSEDYTRFIVSGGHPGDLAMVYGESILDEGVQGKVVDRG
jgi:threonylcarbamoyladenosine tRNA methylthiotransferase MtaB